MGFSVYVVQLDAAAIQRRRFRKANPNYKPGASCYYVGSTAQEPELRFEQHKRGYKCCSYVRDFGLELVPSLYEKYNPIPSRKDAEELESYLTERLRRLGYGVWSN